MSSVPAQRKQMYGRFSTLHCIICIFSLMFIITVFLSFKLLSQDNCPHQSSIIANSPFINEKKVNGRKSIDAGHHKLAVLIPFRDRFNELLKFTPYMSTFLKRQNIDFDLFVLNQVDRYRFNRAALINAGFLEIRSQYDYIVMHDVDLLPLNWDLDYTYAMEPRHLSAPYLHPRYHYNKFIGGVFLINREHFEIVDGLSNKYWGWGLEDDEFYVRLKNANLTLHRPIGLKTGINDTFWHIHGSDRKRDNLKCYNQKEATRKRDRQTGLHNVQYKIEKFVKITISQNPLTIINILLECDKQLTPWCECIAQKPK